MAAPRQQRERRKQEKTQDSDSVLIHIILDGAAELALLVRELEECPNISDHAEDFKSKLEHLRTVFEKESKQKAAKAIASVRNELDTALKKDILENLRDNLLRELRPVQLRELLHYAKKNIEAKDKLKGKRLAVLLGPTGAGKSLALHFFANSKLAKSSNHKIVVTEAAPGTSQVRVSPFARSETTVAHAVVTLVDGQEVWIVDTPGTGDTRGPEVSISTGLGMIRALQSASEVKLWLVISRMMLEEVRLAQLATFLEAVTQLGTDCSGALESFSYIFTNYSEDSVEVRRLINERIRRFLLDGTNLDAQVAAIAKDMFRKTGGYYFHREAPKLSDFVGDYYFTPEKQLKHIQLDKKKYVGKDVKGSWSAVYDKLQECIFEGVYLVCPCDLEGQQHIEVDASWSDAVVLVPLGEASPEVRLALLRQFRDAEDLIKEPQQFFRTMISNDVMGKFRAQLGITQDEIAQLIANKQYKHASQELELLSELVDTLRDSPTSMGEAGKLVFQYYEKAVKHIVAVFQQRFDVTWGQINERWLDNHPISDEKHFKEYNELMQDFGQLRECTVTTDKGQVSVFDHATELEVIERKLASSVLEEQIKVRNVVCKTQMADLYIDYNNVLERLQRLKLHSHFVKRPDLRPPFEDARRHVDGLLQELAATASRDVGGELSVENLSAAGKALQTLTIYASGPELGLSITPAQEAVAKAFHDRVRSVQTETCKFVKKYTVGLTRSPEFASVILCVTVLDACSMAFEIPEVKAVVSKAHQEVQSATDAYYRRLGETVSDLLNNNVESNAGSDQVGDPVVKAFQDCKEVVMEMDQLVADLKCPKESLDASVEMLCHRLTKLRSDTSESLNKFLAEKEVSMALFLQGLRRIQALEWMTRVQGEPRRYHRSEYATLLDEFTAELEEAAARHLNNFEFRIQQMRLTDSALLPIICSTIKALEGFQPLQEFLPKLTSQGQSVKDLCDKLLNQVKKISTEGVPPSDRLDIREALDLEHFRQIDVFLQACGQMNVPGIFLSQIGALRTTISAVSKKYGHLLGKRIEELFTSITRYAPKSKQGEPGDETSNPLQRKQQVDELFALFRRALDGHEQWPEILANTCRPATAGLPGQWQMYLMQIETELLTGQGGAKIRHTAGVLLELTCLDLYMMSAISFLKLPSREEKPFGAMFLKYHSFLQRNVSAALEQAVAALEAQNYVQVKQRLLAIQGNPTELEAFKQTSESFVQLKVNSLTSKLFAFRYYPGRDAQEKEVIDALKDIAEEDTRLGDLRKNLDGMLEEDTRARLTELQNSVFKGFNSVFNDFVSRCRGIVTLPDYSQAEDVLAVIDSMTKTLLVAGYSNREGFPLSQFYHDARGIIKEDLVERETAYTLGAPKQKQETQLDDDARIIEKDLVECEKPQREGAPKQKQETPLDVLRKVFAVRPPLKEFLHIVDTVKSKRGAHFHSQSTHVPYSQSSARICSHIETLFTEALVYVSEALDTQKQNAMVAEMKGLMKQLPPSLSHLEEKCNTQLNELQASQQAHQEEVSKLIERDAFDDMLEHLKKAKDRRDVRITKIVTNHLKARATRRSEEYEKALACDRSKAAQMLREILQETGELERQAEPLYRQFAADCCASFLQTMQNSVATLNQYGDASHVLDIKTIKSSLENIDVLIGTWDQMAEMIKMSNANAKLRTAGSRLNRNAAHESTWTLESLDPSEALRVLAVRIDHIQAELENVLKGASTASLSRAYTAVSESQGILEPLRTCVSKVLKLNCLGKDKLEQYAPRVAKSAGSKLGLSLSEAQEKLVSVAQSHHVLLTRSLLTEAPKLQSQVQREEFVITYRESFAFLTALLATKIAELTGEIQKEVEASVTMFRERLQELIAAIKQIVGGHFSEDSFQFLDVAVGLLRVFSEKLDHTTSPARDAATAYDDVLKEYSRAVKLKKESAFQAQAQERGLELSQLLLELRSVWLNVPVFRKIVDDTTFALFKQVQEGAERDELLRQIVVELRGHTVGRQIVAEQPCLKGFENEMRNQRTLAVTIESALQALKGDNYDNREKAVIEKQYEQILEKYWEAVETTDKPNGSVSKLVQKIREKGNRMKAKQKNKALLLEALPLLFALWTVLKSGHYVGENKDAVGVGNRNFYKKPHPVQVICVLRLLGLDEEDGWWKFTGETLGFLKSAFQGHLAQVGTGEGKSIVLAIVACCFALQGFRVDCACYSDYLGERDYKEFYTMFNALGIEGNIRYGTFQVLCEDIVNGSGSVRENVQNLLMGRPVVLRNVHSEDAEGRVLLVDEVDVFLSEFLAEPYAMQTQWKDEAIVALLKLVWSSRGSLDLNKITESPQYKQLTKKFPTWEFLLRSALVDMLTDLRNFSNPSYTVQNDKIGYTRQDTTSFTQLEGYKTVFAYFHEHEQGHISEKSRDNFVSLFVRCGIFSYALIPKKYALILGVTGTLQELSASQIAMIRQEYSIAKFTYLPSAYGPNQCRWFPKSDKDLQLKPAATQEEHFRQIAIEMNQRVTEVPGVRRPILVIFRDAKQVHAFKASPQLNNFFPRSPINILTEASSSEEKATVVSKATMCGHVTLMTKNFGRGTDFVCFDEKADKAGGLHVLLTFYPAELAEEVQMRGRTARQGQPGSFSMVLSLEQTATQLEFAVDELRAKAELPDTLYNELHLRRLALFEIELQKREGIKTICAGEHKRTEDFVLALAKGEIEKCVMQLKAWNKKSGDVASRTIILMDATGSMGGLLNNCKKAVKQMFERAYDILQKADLAGTKFQVCIAVYRNYGIGPQYLLESSEWTSEPTALQMFLNGIKQRGGQGREAMEVGLAFANKAREFAQVSQVVVIGDMPPNTKEEVADRRRGRSWQNTQFENPTHYQSELELLRQAGVPVHAFWVHAAAQESFTEIATKTGGECSFLDVNGGEGGVELLTNCVTRKVLASTGGEKLVSLYDTICARQGWSIGSK